MITFIMVECFHFGPYNQCAPEYLDSSIQSWPSHERLGAHHGKQIEKRKRVNLATGLSDMHQRVGSPKKNTNRLFGLQWHAHKHQEKQGLQTKDSLLVLAGLLMARYNVINNQMTWRNVPVETESRAGFSISCAFKNCRSDTHGCQASGLSHVQLQTVRVVDPT